MRRSLPRRGPEGGAELIEFALLMPLLMAMLLGIIEYGMMFSRMLSVQSATRDAARWAATPGIPMDEAPAEAVAMLREGLALQGLSCSAEDEAAGLCALSAELDEVEGYTVVEVITRLSYASAAAGLLPVPDELTARSTFMLTNQPVAP